jgi:hypothetical protein
MHLRVVDGTEAPSEDDRAEAVRSTLAKAMAAGLTSLVMFGLDRDGKVFCAIRADDALQALGMVEMTRTAVLEDVVNRSDADDLDDEC